MKYFSDRVWFNGFWFSIFHPWLCPCCHGEGGYGDDSNPYESCLYCNDTGLVGLLARLRWFWYEIEGRIRARRYGVKP